MTHSKEIDTLKFLNKELKKYKVKLDFQYYDTCPFRKNKLEILEIVLKYVELFENYYHKIFILSSLCDKIYSDSVPYLVKTYHYFIDEIYRDPIDEMYLLYLCNTIAKIEALEYTDLYKSILLGPITQSAEPIIEMLAENNMEEFDGIIFNLIKKENIIPKAWLGELNEDSKYWCSFVALKCIVSRKDKKYLRFFQELVDDKNMAWINFTNSKYKSKLTLEWKNKYKVFAEKGIKKLSTNRDTDDDFVC